MQSLQDDVPETTARDVPSPVWAMLVVVITVGLDQLTKAAVCRFLPREQLPRVSIIPGFFSLVHLRNSGAAWGMFQGRSRLLTILAVIVLAYVISQYRRLVNNHRGRGFAIAFLLGGIAGNLIDRIVRGEVVDFLLFFYHNYQWPAFNLADSAITCSVVYLVLQSFFEQRTMKDAVGNAATD